ncbi:MAG TPA: peptidylprolyl isomerase [Arenimonas sp.]|nr:peptidylprolyl isomerase [Arenimonas sp.]
MQIKENSVVSFHYTLTGKDGQVIDSSEGNQPLTYLHGVGQIVPGLENALLGKKSGDKMDVEVSAEEGYGEHHDFMVQQVPREAFQGVDEIEPGMQFQAQTPQGAMTVTVTAADETTVTVDGNHPLAGQPLFFAVEIVSVRDASEEEITHGHVHGEGGHHH